jgi:FKBP-type peptidyl-prolyl cis-trans isomerase 2/predicted Fe-Mo cluster-binding NifX family protein
MLIAIPSDAPGGLDAPISAHFGHCAAFTLVRVDDKELGNVEVLENSGHEQGGCMMPVTLLKEQGVDVLVAGGMGGRPLAGFQQVGIKVHFKEDATSVKEAVDLFLTGKCREFGAAQTCGGGGGSCGGHHEVEREPIEGPHDVRDNRVVTLDFVLKDPDGNLIESSRTNGPMRYLHGSGMILPALEKAFTGLEEGAQTTVELSSADAFGERDEARILEVPRHQLPPDITVGALVSGTDPSGQRIGLIVIELGDEVARVDANHPLAGKDLVFEVTVVKVESATPEELAHGHVH